MLIKWKTSSILSKDYSYGYVFLIEMISMRYFRKDGRLIQSNSCSTDLRKRKSIKKLPRPIKDKNFFIISFRRKLYELFVVSQFFSQNAKKRECKKKYFLHKDQLQQVHRTVGGNISLGLNIYNENNYFLKTTIQENPKLKQTNDVFLTLVCPVSHKGHILSHNSNQSASLSAHLKNSVILWMLSI